MQIRPATLTESDFSRALKAFGAALDTQGLIVEPEGLAEFRDPFAFRSWDEFAPSAALLPRSVAEVQAIVRIANEHKVPLWTSSQGRNNGYGGAAPRVRGGVVLSLRRMNRILEVNEESAYALGAGSAVLRSVRSPQGHRLQVVDVRTGSRMGQHRR